jgi:hypothetical protein
MELKKLYFNTGEKGDAGIITAASAIKTIIENPHLPILEEDSNITPPTGKIRYPCFNDDPSSPRFKLFMEHLISDMKIDLFFTFLLRCGRTFDMLLGKVFHR